MTELADVADLKSAVRVGHVGSNPTPGTGSSPDRCPRRPANVRKMVKLDSMRGSPPAVDRRLEKANNEIFRSASVG